VNSYAYFSSLVYRDEKPDWVAHTLDITKKYFSDAPQNEFVIQTDQMVNDSNLEFLNNHLIASAYNILVGQGYDMQKYELYVGCIWGQNFKAIGGMPSHVHKNSQICGWFFLETSEGSVYPVYQDVRANKQMVELDYIQGSELTNASSQVHFNNVIPGTILMANSWLPHQLVATEATAQSKMLHFTICHREKICSTY